MAVINLALACVVVGYGLQLNGDTLSVNATQSSVTSVIAPAASTLTLAGNDSSGGLVTLGVANTITSTSAWQGIVFKTNNQSGDYSILSTDIYVGYTGAGGHTFTLPAAASHTGRLYMVKSRGGTLTLAVTGGGELWTNAVASTMTLIAGECAVVISDGTYWVVTSMASGLITL